MCLPVQMLQRENNHRTCSNHSGEQLGGFKAALALDTLISLSEAAAAEERHEDASVLRQEQAVPGRAHLLQGSCRHSGLISAVRGFSRSTKVCCGNRIKRFCFLQPCFL